MLLVLGGASFSQLLSPVKLASLDPAGIRAEAEAIDIQIQLSNLNYAESLNPALTIATSTVFTATGGNQPTAQAKPAVAPNNSATPTPPLSIDQALEKLAE